MGGKRNPQRGLEFQREIIHLADGLDAHVRDTCCFHHEGGDLEIEGIFYGCKRRKALADFLFPEKKEMGVFVRADRGRAMVVIPAKYLFELLRIKKTAQAWKPKP